MNSLTLSCTIIHPFGRSDNVLQLDQLTKLMQQAQAGNQQAYTQFLQQSAARLRPFLQKRLNSHFEVDDVTQEILISIHKARNTYDGKRPVLPWLFAIANFRLQDHWRNVYGDELKEALDIDELDEQLPRTQESEFDFSTIQKLIDQLPEKQALILRLIHQQGHTAKEVAQQLNMNESAVKVAAHRAYKVLRTELETSL